MTEPLGGSPAQGVTSTPAWAAVAQQASAPAMEAAPFTAQQAPVQTMESAPPTAQFGPIPGPTAEQFAGPYVSPPPAPKRGRAGVIVLSIATGVLALATAALGVLYFLESDARADTQKELAQKTEALVTEEAKAKNLDGQLKASKEEVAKLNQDLTGAKSKTDEVTKARDAMAACFQALEEYGRSRTSANAKAANEKCSEASKHY